MYILKNKHLFLMCFVFYLMPLIRVLFIFEDQCKTRTTTLVSISLMTRSVSDAIIFILQNEIKNYLLLFRTNIFSKTIPNIRAAKWHLQLPRYQHVKMDTVEKVVSWNLGIPLTHSVFVNKFCKTLCSQGDLCQ